MFPFLAIRFLVSFLSYLGGSPKIDLPLSMFSLANTFFTSLFSDSTLLVGETKKVVLVEAILGEEKLYYKVVIYNYILCWLYSMTKSVVFALILFLVVCGILLYWV